MDGRDEAGGAERALARLNERPADASVKSATWTCALLMSSSSTSDDRALASIGVGIPYDMGTGPGSPRCLFTGTVLFTANL
jgi:hypothetical protein